MKRKPIIFGISGPQLTTAEVEFFHGHPVLGFILFRRNIESSEQLQELVASLKGLYGGEQTLVFVDQEGGRVARVKPPIASKEYPAAAVFEDLYVSNREPALVATKANYRELMEDLRRFGIDSPTCPVADLRHVGAHDVIGDRSFGSEVGTVVALSTAAIRGITEAGGIPVVKHMPGHGRAVSDSHYSLPTIAAPLEELAATDFAVFAQLSQLPWMIWAMTAHIVVAEIDPDRPATLSARVIDYIRRVIGFKGTLVTDDICMAALHGEVGTRYCVIKRVLTKSQTEALEPADYSALRECGATDDHFQSQEFSAQLHQLRESLDALKPVFTASIASAAHESITAGCDVVLHCSGDLGEMIAVCDAIA